MHEGTLAVHEVELVVKSRPGLSNGGGVGKHGNGSLDVSEATILRSGRDSHGLLVVDAELETSRAPLDQVEGGLGLESSGSNVAVAGNNVTTVQQSNSHVLAIAGVADNHLIVGLEALEGDIVDLEALMLALGGRDNGSIADQRVVDTGVRNQVGLELVQIHVQGTIKTQRRGDGADDLSNQAVQVIVGRARNIQTAAADVVNSLVVNKESTVRVLNGAVGRQNGVVRLNDGSGNTRSWVDGEFELRLLAILGGKALKEESTETRTGTTTERVENEETLERVAVVSDTADAVNDIVDHLLSDSVVTTSVIVGSILLAADQQLRVEERTVTTGTNLIDGGGVKIDEERTRNMLPTAGLSEEGLEGTGVTNVLGIGVNATISTEAVLEEVELPGRVTQLGTGLADVEVKNLALHGERWTARLVVKKAERRLEVTAEEQKDATRTAQR